MADLPAPEHPVQTLNSMSNFMLVQTGKFFRNAASVNPKPLILEKKALQSTSTIANNRFHDALDEMEVEILRAKAVFERDLRRLRAKRAERERAAGILTKPAGVIKHQSPKPGLNKVPSVNDGQTADKSIDTATAPKPQPTDRTTVDGVAADKGPSLEMQDPQYGPVEVAEADAGGAPDVTTSTDSQALDPTVGLAIDFQPDTQASKDSSPKPQEHHSTAVSQPTSNPADETQTTNQQEAAPFESMFNDLENPSNPTSLDFDLGFSSNGNISQDLHIDAVFDQLDSTNNQQNLNLAPTSAEDIDTLLPGLDNYVNDGGDFSISDMSLLATAPESSNVQTTLLPVQAATNEGTQQQQNQQQQQPQLDSAPMESNFDDLFGSGDWGDMDDELGGGTMGDFDDSWFKTDG